MIGIVLLLVGLIVMKFLHETALKALNQDQKARLIDGFSSFRMFGLVGLIGFIVIAYMLLGYFFNGSSLKAWWSGAVPLLAILVYFFLADRRINRLGLPAAYIRKWRLGLLIFILGLAASYFSATLDDFFPGNAAQQLG